MKKITLMSGCTLLFMHIIYAQAGFNTVTNLVPLSIVSNTGEIPQSKVWTYAGKHWTVLTDSAVGTVIYRLDGTTWTNVLVLASGTNTKVDIKVVGNVTHIFFWKGIASYLFSVEYDPATNKYKLWTARKKKSDVTLETGVKSATIDIDGTGRMWLASDGSSTVNVRWSDAPYTVWSNPITIATGTTTNDLCAVVALPSNNKIGVFWSNKNTKRFGFKTHTDGTDPTVWSSDEAPGAAYALNIGAGFADNQFNIKATQDGTLYGTIKTNYNTVGYPQIALLIRRPNGTWDAPYPVTFNEGTYPIVIINESLNKLKVIYSLNSGSNISYKESSATSISFSLPFLLINGLYNYSTSTKATHGSEIVVLASNSTTAVGVLATENNSAPDQTPPSVVSVNRQSPATDPTNATSVTFRVSFSEPVIGVDVSDFALTSSTVDGTISSVTQISQSVYDVTVSSVTGSGTLRLDLNSGGTGITDMALNAIATGGFTNGQTYTINQGIPTLTLVSIASGNPTPSLAKPGDIVSLSFTASEPINSPAVTIATHAVTATAGSGNSFTATYTLIESDASGLVPVTVDFSNTAGTAGVQVTATTNGSIVNFDKTPPTAASINRQSPTINPTNAASVTFRVTFSEAMNGVDASDFTLTTTGTASGIITSVNTISSSIYDATVTSVSGNGTLRVDLIANNTGITDIAGNAINGGFIAGQTYTIAQGIPTLSSVSIASNNSIPSLAKPGDVISLSFTASEPINPPVVTIATHATITTAGSGNSFTATYTMTSNDASGVVPFTINFTNMVGTAGAQVTATTNGSIVNFDQIPPSVVRINCHSPATDTTNATTVTFRATFTEPVSGVDLTDFSLTGSTVSGIVSSVTSISGSKYDVTVSSISGNGTLRLDLKSGTGITDIAGYAITAGFSGGQTYTIDQCILTLTSVSVASGNAIPSMAKPGDVVSLSFTASNPINPPTVTIATHAVTATAVSDNSFITSYTMAISDATGVVPFTVNFSNAAGTTGTQVTATTNGDSVTFDKSPPTVISIHRQSPSTSTTNATTVTFRATFSELVSGVDASDFLLTITNGSVSGVISSVGLVSANVYDVTVTSVIGNGIFRLDLKSTGTGITDIAANAITGGFTGGQTYSIQPGFSSVVRLDPVDNITNTTQDKPQAKAWNYANKWWCVLPVTGGTKIFRLDGTTWTSILTLSSSTCKADCIVVGDLVHILGFKGSSAASFMYTVEYDPALETYKLWHLRPSNSPITFGAGAETATLIVDGTGRLWASCEGLTDIKVWWSDAPYTTWSTPVTIASGVEDDDICAITTIPGQGKIGVFWSNQNTLRFGFKTHADGASPGSWSADELPASQSAIDSIGTGFADDHMNIKVASDGTMYCSVKTSYDKKNYPRLMLFVRRPAGTWDSAYTVTIVKHEGTQPMVLLDEPQGKLRVIYSSLEVGGDILYRESTTSPISFGSALTLISDPGILYNYATSTHQNCNSEVLIIATDVGSSPQRAVSVLASDGLSSFQSSEIPMVVKSASPQLLKAEKSESVIEAFPNPFASGTNLKFALPYSADYELALYDGRGIKQTILKKGWAEAWVPNTVKLEGATLASGIYFIRLQSGSSSHVMKVLLQK